MIRSRFSLHDGPGAKAIAGYPGQGLDVSLVASGKHVSFRLNLVAILLDASHRIDGVIGRCRRYVDDFGPQARQDRPHDTGPSTRGRMSSSRCREDSTWMAYPAAITGRQKARRIPNRDAKTADDRVTACATFENRIPETIAATPGLRLLDGQKPAGHSHHERPDVSRAH